MPDTIVYRPASLQHALTLSVLATQVFLDTYATQGVSADLAKEASTVYSPQAFKKRLRRAGVEIVVATRGEHLIAFVDLDTRTRCPVSAIQGLEVMRLYVQAPFHRTGLGRALMAIAERRALEQRAGHVWLTAWSGNVNARAFYAALGYEDVGATDYVIEGKAYENRVFAKQTTANASSPPSTLPGLGPKSDAALRAAGITTLAELRRLGAVRAYIQVKRTWPAASLNMLWALEGALSGEPWQVVAREHRLSLLLALEAAENGSA